MRSGRALLIRISQESTTMSAAEAAWDEQLCVRQPRTHASSMERRDKPNGSDRKGKIKAGWLVLRQWGRSPSHARFVEATVPS
jgi:hypothetical protein